MSLVIKKLDEVCNHVLVHTGQNFDYDLNQVFHDLGIKKPDYFLGVAGAGPSDTIAQIISETDKVFKREAPDAVLIYGDTNKGREKRERKLGRGSRFIPHLGGVGASGGAILPCQRPSRGERRFRGAGKSTAEVLNALAAEYDFPVIVSTHPRTRKRLNDLQNGESELSPLVRFSLPLALRTTCALQLGAYCVLSDSGTITEESSLLDLPAVTMREAHERPEGMDAGTLVMSGPSDLRICWMRFELSAKVIASAASRELSRITKEGKVLTKVVRIVISYIDFINRVVWSKPNVEASASALDCLAKSRHPPSQHAQIS